MDGLGDVGMKVEMWLLAGFATTTFWVAVVMITREFLRNRDRFSASPDDPSARPPKPRQHTPR